MTELDNKCGFTYCHNRLDYVVWWWGKDKYGLCAPCAWEQEQLGGFEQTIRRGGPDTEKPFIVPFERG